MLEIRVVVQETFFYSIFYRTVSICESRFQVGLVFFDPEHIEEYKAIIARLKDEQAADYKLKPLHTHYFRGDYSAYGLIISLAHELA